MVWSWDFLFGFFQILFTKHPGRGSASRWRRCTLPLSFRSNRSQALNYLLIFLFHHFDWKWKWWNEMIENDVSPWFDDQFIRNICPLVWWQTKLMPHQVWSIVLCECFIVVSSGKISFVCSDQTAVPLIEGFLISNETKYPHQIFRGSWSVLKPDWAVFGFCFYCILDLQGHLFINRKIKT